MLEGRHFTVYKDHNPLVAALRRVSPPWSPRQQRQLAFISEYTTDVRHVPGKDNLVADALSRPPVPVVPPDLFVPPDPVVPSVPVVPPDPVSSIDVPRQNLIGLDFSAAAVKQLECQDSIQLKSRSDLHVVPLPVPGGMLFCDISTGIARPILPAPFRFQAFLVTYSVSHPGIRASRRLVSSRFLWPGMNKDMNNWE